MGVVYEWDEAKRALNLQNHGLDFADAGRVYEAKQALRISSPRQTPQGVEDRTVTIASVRIGKADLVLVVVTVPRGDNVRVISLRRAHESERAALHRALQ